MGGKSRKTHRQVSETDSVFCTLIQTGTLLCQKYMQSYTTKYIQDFGLKKFGLRCGSSEKPYVRI